MSERAWERPAASIRRFGPADGAVSPVVGMILVLAISIVGTATILYWGLPAIDEMKANVEFRSVEGQFSELDATLKELVAGTTEKTAKRWQPSLNRGELSVRSGEEGWLFATEPYNATADHDIGWSSFADGDSQFTLHNLAAIPLTWVKVECYVVTGTSSLTALNVSLSSASRAQMTGANLVLWNPGAKQDFHLFQRDVNANVPIPIAAATFECRVYTGASLVAEGWYADTGSIHYDLSAGIGRKSIIENNGGILTGDGESYAITNSPSLPPVTTTAGVPRFFGRAIVLTGDAAFAGEDRFDLLVSLYSSAVLGSYDCASKTRSDCAESSKIYVYGDLRPTWYSYLTNTGKGYTFTEKTLPDSGGVTYLEDREPFMGYTLLQSTVLMQG